MTATDPTVDAFLDRATAGQGQVLAQWAGTAYLAVWTNPVRSNGMSCNKTRPGRTKTTAREDGTMISDDEFDLWPAASAAAFGVVGEDEDGPPMLEFRGHDGRCLAVPYARLLSVDLRPERGVTLEFPDHHITVRGRNLRPLFEALLTHRVTYVQEGDLDTVSEDDPFIDRIVSGPLDPDTE